MTDTPSVPLPKIYVFVNQRGPAPDWIVTQALAEDGMGLGSHVSSNDWYAKHDIGATSNWHHDTYRAYYPDGYEVEWVDDPSTHAALLAVFELNQKLTPEQLNAANKKIARNDEIAR